MRVGTLSLALGCMLLAGCGEEKVRVANVAGAAGNAAGPGNAPPESADKAVAPSAISSADGLDAHITCWALTNRAYFMHQANRSGGGNLPKPASEVYLAWGGLAATTANGAAMKLSKFERRGRKRNGKPLYILWTWTPIMPLPSSAASTLRRQSAGIPI